MQPEACREQNDYPEALWREILHVQLAHRYCDDLKHPWGEAVTIRVTSRLNLPNDVSTMA